MYSKRPVHADEDIVARHSHPVDPQHRILSYRLELLILALLCRNTISVADTRCTLQRVRQPAAPMLCRIAPSDDKRRKKCFRFGHNCTTAILHSQVLCPVRHTRNRDVLVFDISALQCSVSQQDNASRLTPFQNFRI